MRAAAGAGEPAAEVAARLERHEAGLAPIVRAGRPVSLITREGARALERNGPPGAVAGEAASGAAPVVTPGAGLPAMWRASRGVSPGLLVIDAGHACRGVIARDDVARHAARERARAHPPAWLREPDLSRLLRKLHPDDRRLLDLASTLAVSLSMPLYLVGGIVRDLLLGRPGRDLDLVMEGDGLSFARELAGRLGARVVVHPSFMTAEVLVEGRGHVDVITARRERYEPPGSLPLVERGSLEDDLARRDVTVNAMAIRLDGRHRGRLRDDLGGREDLREGLLRVHHALSVIDDPTRALRIARLAARLRFGVAGETIAALDLARRARAMDRVSGARVRRELAAILEEPDPRAALDAMARLHLLDPIAPGLAWNAIVRRHVVRLVSAARSRREGRFDDADPFLVLLMILADDRPSTAGRSLRERIAGRLGLQGRAAGILIHGPSRRREIVSSLRGARRPSTLARAFERHDPETLLFSWATGDQAVRQAMKRWAGRAGEPVPGVTGHTLRSLGVPPGPVYARLLGRIREAWLDGRIVDAASAHALARRLVRRRR